MARQYAITFEQVAVTAAQDLVQVIGAAGKIARIKRVWVGCTDTTIPAAQMISLRCRFLPATVSNGSGGSAPTPRPFDAGDAASSVTALANSTSKATSNGTVTILYENGVHLFAGDDHSFPAEARPIVGPSESFVWELLSTVVASLHLSGGVEYEELGG